MFVLDIQVKRGIKKRNENFLNCSPKTVKQQNRLPPNYLENNPRVLPWKKQIAGLQGLEKGETYILLKAGL